MKFKSLLCLTVATSSMLAINVGAGAPVLYIDSNGNGFATGCTWSTLSTFQIPNGPLQVVEGLTCSQTGSASVITKVKYNGVCSSVNYNGPTGFGGQSAATCSSWAVWKFY